jgi:hypothetical protein
VPGEPRVLSARPGGDTDNGYISDSEAWTGFDVYRTGDVWLEIKTGGMSDG